MRAEEMWLPCLGLSSLSALYSSFSHVLEYACCVRWSRVGCRGLVLNQLSDLLPYLAYGTIFCGWLVVSLYASVC